jgi:carboxylate-amine ligase
VPIDDIRHRSAQAQLARPGYAVAAAGYAKRMPDAAGLTLGVEEEFLLVDGGGHLVASGPEITRGAADSEGQVEHELSRCQVESATKVCTEVAEVVRGLTELRDELAAQAHRRRLRLLVSGVAPLAEDGQVAITRDDRYQRMAAEFGGVARSSLTCACHIHVSIPDRATGLAISNRVRPWLPVLLALTANSPWHDGRDTRYASWRHVMWSRWPSAGPPPWFGSVDHYDSTIAGLAATGAILDRGMIYWDIRLSEHQPTLEIRIADVAATPREAALLAVLVRALAGCAIDSGPAAAPDPGPAEVILRAQLWRAARDGLAGRCVDPDSGALVPTWRLVEGLVDRLTARLRSTGDEDFVADAMAKLRETGSGAQRQRAAYARRLRDTDIVDTMAWPLPFRETVGAKRR